MWHALAFLVVIGCSQKNGAPEPSETPASETPAAEAPATETPAAETPSNDGAAEAEAEAPTPEGLYEECKARVEGPQAEGECEADADCKAAGCSTEVCTTVANANGIMTTCEGKLCFKILDTCGCNEGQCTWSLKSEVPPLEGPKPADPLPPTRLPPSPPPPEPAGDE